MDDTFFNIFMELREFICVKMKNVDLPPDLQETHRSLCTKLENWDSNYLLNFHTVSGRGSHSDSLLLPFPNCSQDLEQSLVSNYPIMRTPLEETLTHVDDHIYEILDEDFFRCTTNKVNNAPSCSNKAVQMSPEDNNRQSFVSKKAKKIMAAFAKLRGQPSTEEAPMSICDFTPFPKLSQCQWHGQIFLSNSRMAVISSSGQSLSSPALLKAPSTSHLSSQISMQDAAEKAGGYRASLKRISGRRRRDVWNLRTGYLVWRPDPKLLLFKPSRHSLPSLETSHFHSSLDSGINLRSSVVSHCKHHENADGPYQEGELDMEIWFRDVKDVTSENDDSEGVQIIRITPSQESLQTIFLVPRKPSEFNTLLAGLQCSLELSKPFELSLNDYVAPTMNEDKTVSFTEANMSFKGESTDVLETSACSPPETPQYSSYNTDLCRNSHCSSHVKQHQRESALSHKSEQQTTSPKSKRIASFLSDCDVPFLKTKMPFSSSHAPSSSSSFLISPTYSTSKQKSNISSRASRILQFLPNKMRKESSIINRRMPLYGGHRGTLIPVNPLEISMQGKLWVRSPIFNLSKSETPKSPLHNLQRVSSSASNSMFHHSRLWELLSFSQLQSRAWQKKNEVSSNGGKDENSAPVSALNAASEKWHHRYCLLSRGLLSVFHMPRKGMGELLVQFSMSSCYVTYDENDLARDHFRFVIGEGLRTLLILEAGDQIEYVNWITALTKAIPKPISPDNRPNRQSFFNVKQSHANKVKKRLDRFGELMDVEEADSSSLDELDIPDSGLYETANFLVAHSVNTLESLHGKKCKGRKHMTLAWRDKTEPVLPITVDKRVAFGRSLSLSVLGEENKASQVKQRAKANPLLGSRLSSSDSSSDCSTPKDGSCPFLMEQAQSYKPDEQKGGYQRAASSEEPLELIPQQDEEDTSPRIELPVRAPKRTTSNEFSIHRLFSRKSSMMNLTSWINRSVLSSPGLLRRSSGTPSIRRKTNHETSSLMNVGEKEEEMDFTETNTSSQRNLPERTGSKLGSFRQFGELVKSFHLPQRKKVSPNSSSRVGVNSSLSSSIHSSLSSLSMDMKREEPLQEDEIPSDGIVDESRTLRPNDAQRYFDSYNQQTDVSVSLPPALPPKGGSKERIQSNFLPAPPLDPPVRPPKPSDSATHSSATSSSKEF